jgi:hypothetical protein
MALEGQIAVALNPSVGASMQTGTLQRTFRDALYPRLMFRLEAIAELWPVNLGGRQVFTRTALMRTVTRPLAAGAQPQLQSYGLEQWDALARQWASSIDTHMPTSTQTLASQYIRNIHQLGLQSGQSLNRAVRDSAYNAYTGGNGIIDTNATSGATTVHVSNLTGLTRKLLDGHPELVSSGNALPITIPAISYTGVITGFTADEPLGRNEIGPGILTISPAIGSNITAPQAVLAANRAQVVLSGGGNSINDLGSTDVFTLADFRTAVSRLKFNDVPRHEDGAYHFHMDPTTVSEIFSDSEFQLLNRGLPDHIHYRRFAVGFLLGAACYENNECPQTVTCDPDPVVGNTHGFQTATAAGLDVHRAILTGAGYVEEKYLDESRFISQAGTLGKIGEFAVTNMGVQVMTERIRLVMRSPLDPLQQTTTSSWSFSGDFPIPSDELSPKSTATFKRAVVVQHV